MSPKVIVEIRYLQRGRRFLVKYGKSQQHDDEEARSFSTIGQAIEEVAKRLQGMIDGSFSMHGS